MANQYEITERLAETVQYRVSDLAGIMATFRTVGYSSDYLSHAGHETNQYWALISAAETFLQMIEQELDKAQNEARAKKLQSHAIQEAHAQWVATRKELAETLDRVDREAATASNPLKAESELHAQWVAPLVDKQAEQLERVINAKPVSELDLILKFHVLAKEDFNVVPDCHDQITAEIDEFLAQNGA